MKKLNLIICLSFLIHITVSSFSQTIHTVTEVYTDQTIINGNTLNIVGYYTDPDVDFLIEFYGDWDKDEVMEPHTRIVLEGVVPPASAWNGGYIIVHGIVTFVVNPDPYYVEDSLIAHLNVFAVDGPTCWD